MFGASIMTRPATTVDQILEARARHIHESKGLKAFLNRYAQLNDLVGTELTEPRDDEVAEKCRREALRYIPIALVAAMEGYLRFCVRDLVDRGSPFQERAKSLQKNWKPDFTLLSAIANRKLSLGEIVAHFIPCNKVEDIIGTLSEMTESSFVDRVRAAKVPGFLVPVDLSSHVDGYYRDIQKVFRLRHIFCHEHAPDEAGHLENIDSMMTSVLMFIVLCDVVVASELSSKENIDATAETPDAKSENDPESEI